MLVTARACAFFPTSPVPSSRPPSQVIGTLHMAAGQSAAEQSRGTLPSLHRFTLHSASCPAWLPPMDASRGTSSNIFPMPQIPALLFPPPPPPAAAALPSSSLSLSSYSSSSSLRHAPSITSFPILVLTVLGILAASVLLLAYYVFVIRCCLTWHRDRAASSTSDVAGLIISRRGRRTQRTTAPADADADAEPRGLEDAAIRALPAFSYRKKPANASAAAAESSAPASECAVCLGEFEEGDRVRMLPACLHVFHLGCVDAWLQGNASCPLCRASADVAATLCRLPPLPPEEEVAVTIQVVVPGAEEDGQDALAQQREAIVAPAAEFEGEDTCTDRQVGGEKTKSAIDGCHVMTERRKDGYVVLPRTRRSFSVDGGAMGGGVEVHPQIQSILQRDSHSRRDDHDSDSGGGGRV